MATLSAEFRLSWASWLGESSVNRQLRWCSIHWCAVGVHRWRSAPDFEFNQTTHPPDPTRSPHFRPPSGWTASDRTMKFSTIDSRGNGQSNDVQHECTWCDNSGEMNYLLWRTPSPAKAVVTVRSEDKNGNNLNNSRCHGCPTRKRHEFHCKVLGGSDCSAVKQTKEAKSHRGDLWCFDRWKCGKLNQSVGDLFEIVTWTLDCIRRILFKFFKINFRSQVPPGGLDPTKIRKN